MALKKLLRSFRLHALKTGVVAVNLLVGNRLSYLILRALCSSFLGNRAKAVFLLYPAHIKYARAYVYDWYLKRRKWKPTLLGLIVQNGRWTPYFGIAATHSDLWQDAKHGGHNLRRVDEVMQDLQILFQSEQRSYAGIIPGILSSLGTSRPPVERVATIEALKRALRSVLEQEGHHPPDVPVIVLGGRGYIGKELTKEGRDPSLVASRSPPVFPGADGREPLRRTVARISSQMEKPPVLTPTALRP